MIDHIRRSPTLPGLDVLHGWPLVDGRLGRWGVTAVAVLIGLGLRHGLDSVLPTGMSLLALVPVVGVVALLAGTWPAVAAILATMGVTWFRLELPFYSVTPASPESVALVLFAAVSATEVALVHALRGAVRQMAFGEAGARALARRQALLFADLQHRVSNDLTVIGALLARRGREMDDPGARRALEDAAARLGVAARLSRRLHNPAAQEVDFAELLREMVPDILAVAGAERRIAVDLETVQVTITAQQAIPLALVATELLSNAIQHGFPGTEGGRIEIQIERTGPETARLLLRHDGLGLPSGFRLSRASGLGLTVACQLAETAGADLVIVQDRGVVSCLTFMIAARDPAAVENWSLPLRPSGTSLPSALRAAV